MNTRTIFLVVLLVIGCSWATARGFNLGDIIEVKTPIELQEAYGLSRKMTLNDSRKAYKRWSDEIQYVGAEWRGDIDGGAEVEGFLDNLTMKAFDYVGPTVMGIPVVGPLLFPLVGYIGMRIKRKGDSTPEQLNEQKESSYNKGVGVAEALLKSAIEAKSKN